MQKWILHAVAVCAMAMSSFAGDTNQNVAAGSYQIRNRKFDELLRPENANSANGTHIVLYPAQPWKCMTWKLLPASGGGFNLQNHFTSKTFDSKTNAPNSVVVQVPWAKEISHRPAWRFTRLADGYYQIADARSGDCLTGSSQEVITLAPWKQAPEQEWELVLTDPSKLTM